MLATHILCYRYVNILDCRHTDSSVYVCRTSLHTVGIFTVLSFCHLYCNTAATCPLQLCVWVFCVWVFCVWVSVLTGPSSGGHLYCLAASIACGRPVAIQVTPWSPSTVSKWLHELVDSIWLQSYIKNCHRNMWMSGREREWVSDLVPRFILLGLKCTKTLLTLPPAHGYLKANTKGNQHSHSFEPSTPRTITSTITMWASTLMNGCVLQMVAVGTHCEL